MVKIALQISANLGGLTALKPDGPDFRFFIKFKCGSCGELPDHWQHVSLEDSHPLKGGRGEANAVIKCKLCARENSCSILEESFKSYDYSDRNRFKSIVAFDCRGMEPVEFDPRDSWTAKGFELDHDEDANGEDGRETGSEFENVDVANDWADYDDKMNSSVCVSEFNYQFIKLH